jgi:hypothetical protein
VFQTYHADQIQPWLSLSFQTINTSVHVLVHVEITTGSGSFSVNTYTFPEAVLTVNEFHDKLTCAGETRLNFASKVIGKPSQYIIVDITGQTDWIVDPELMIFPFIKLQN